MKIPARVTLLNLAVIAIACAGPLGAATVKTTTTTRTTTTRMKRVPAFATKAAQGGMAEVELGQMAADKATDPDVKTFAQQMVTDHTKANDELKQLASTKGWTLPENTDAKHKAAVSRLQKETGATFDKGFMNAMVADHNAVVAMFRSYSKSGADPELKSWASTTLPTLEQHQKMAKDTQAKLTRAAAK